jgi:tRNA(fMet)-specific endonuclease VapC
VSGRPGQDVLDTSTLVLLPRLADAADLPAEPLITAVTLAELAIGPLVARDEGERARRQANLQQAEADFVPFPSTPAPLAPSAWLPLRCVAAAATRLPVAMTR